MNDLYRNAFSKIHGECPPDEIDAIFKIVKELKATLHPKKYLIFISLKTVSDLYFRLI